MRLFLLIAASISVLLTAGSAFAASVPAMYGYYIGNSNTYPTPEEACKTKGEFIASPDKTQCGYINSSGGFNAIGNLGRSYTCDGIGGSLSAGMCVCPGTDVPEDGVCKPPNPCSSKAGWWDNGGDPQSVNLPGPLPFYSGESGGKIGMPDTICINGCVADTTQDRGDGMSTSSWWGYNMNPKYSGKSCSPGDPKPGTSKPKDSEEKKCVDKGMGFGYVNQNVICVKPDTSSGSAKKSSETKNPDGTTTKTDTVTNISCNAEGACTTTTTTTTTVINADGSTASTKTDTKKEDSQGNTGTGTADGTGFCKENPNSPMCKSGSFNGSCAQPPSCEGDPIQCATAKAVFETNCKTLKPGDPPTTTDPVGEKKHNLSFEVTELSGGGVCPADRFIQINGKMVHFELSVICQFAIMLRPIIIALAWLIAGYIVFGWGNKRG